MKTSRPSDRRSARHKPWLAVTVAAVLTMAGCAGDRSAPGFDFGFDRPNVLLISIDSLRADHLGTYGYERDTSPNIDALAAQGVVFENAVSSSTWTLPAHMTMLSALNARVHQVIDDGRKLTEAATLVSEVLQAGGWRTGAVVSGPYLQREFGFDQGFDVYDDETVSFGGLLASHRGNTSSKTQLRALELLYAFDDDPFFLFLHYWDVHYDYQPPAPYDSMFDPDYQGDIDARNFDRSATIRRDMDPRDLEHVVALYDGEIAYVDSYLGRLFEELKRLGLWERTLVIVTADHGDEFFEHGRKGHRKTLYRETLQVPLVIKFPSGRWAGERVDGLTGLVDIAPTILEVAGLARLPESNGRSLLDEIRGDAEPTVYFADLHEELDAVMLDPLKLIRGNQRGEQLNALFDMRTDPAESADLAQRRADDLDELAAALDRWIIASATLAEQVGSGEFEYEEELTRALRGLGYLR